MKMGTTDQLQGIATWCLFAVVSTLLWSSAKAGKVLLLSVQVTGHLNEMAIIGKELVKSGHDVYIVLDKDLKQPMLFKGTGIKYLLYSSVDKNHTKLPLDLFGDSKSFVGGNVVGYLEAITTNRDRITNDCSNALYDDNLLHQIKGLTFDIALVDGLVHCYHLIPYVLDIPYITISSTVFPYMTRMHPLIATRPCYIQGDANTYLTRLKVFFGSILIEQLPKFFIKENEFVYYAKDKPFSSLYHVVSKSKMWFIKQNLISDCPRPEMPNVVYIGGMTSGRANPLPPKFQDLLDTSKQGVILFTTGTSVSKLPLNVTKKFMTAFKFVKETVVWRLKLDKKSKLAVPKNVKLFDWVPQNDILGHPNVKLFITHCGNNGQNEALYHGVPMIGIPIFGDQFYNAERMVHKGYGEQLDFQHINTEELVEKIRIVQLVKKYRENAQRASKLMKWREHPLDQVTNWVEYILEFGDEELKTAASNMSLLQFLMFDIFALIGLVLLFSVYTLKWCIMSIIRRVRRKFKKKTCTGKSPSNQDTKKKTQ
ncbi:UDP-glucuronosyltransferase 2C1-like [Lineus longissimus]|uniref:UDP-glucuronosyltransferase 2C1-like n=1 Tax=Lineus longissimus TaxID=88925 RepID=UPI002B4D7EA3